MRGDRNIDLSGGDVVKRGRTKCERRAKPHGKRPPDAQLWLRKQTIPKSANTIPACAMRGSRWRKDASPSTFLTCVIVAFVLIFASGLEWFGSASAAIDRPRVRSETSEHDATLRGLKLSRLAASGMISRDLAKGCQAYCIWCSIPVRKTTGRAPLESNQIRSGAMLHPGHTVLAPGSDRRLP